MHAASAWEAAAKRAAQRAHGACGVDDGGGDAAAQADRAQTRLAGQGGWVNSIMYMDVVAKHNSELTYLLPLVRAHLQSRCLACTYRIPCRQLLLLYTSAVDPLYLQQ